MNAWPILDVVLEREADMVAARGRARRIAELLGFDAQDRTRLATAVSEIVRNAVVYAGGGRAEFLVAHADARPRLVVRVSDRGPGIVDVDAVLRGADPSPNGLGLGMAGARRLVDGFGIESAPGQGTVVTLEKRLPKTAPPVSQARVAELKRRLASETSGDPLLELRAQNQELLRSLGELRAQQEETKRLNEELDSTNKGVIALYAELDLRTVELQALNEDLERKVTERALARGRTWQISPEIMGVLNANGYFDHSNPAWGTVLGWSKEEVARAHFLELIHPDDLERTKAAWAGAKERGEPALRFENRYRTKDNGWRWLSWVAVPEDDKIYCSARDVTQEKEREAELAVRTAERDRLWGLTNLLMATAGYDSTIREVNPAWPALLGWSKADLVGRSYTAFVHPDDVERSLAWAATLTTGGALPDLENRYLCKNGAYRSISWTITAEQGVLHCVGRDVTAEKERAAELTAAQDQLRQSQKLEAVGQLTGGVAHDFNNLLTVIKSSTELLRRPGLADERRRRYIDAISDTVDRASRLTSQLLSFARRQALRPETINVADRIRSITEMLATIVGSRIRIVVDVSKEPCFITADASQFETALVNLAVNARDAMDGEGTLEVRVHRTSNVPAIRTHELRAGDFVCIALADTGTGIPTDKLTQIFEPFYTTKEVGKGTGLGLSQVYGFTKQSGGDVRVESTVGVGTIFTLYLPEVEAPPEAPEATRRAPAPFGRSGVDRPRRVLVVEDNEQVGAFSTQLLQDLGYETLWAANGHEALRHLAERDDFDAVFSDVVMPGMSGIELGGEIRRLYSDLPVVLTSGYSHVLAEKGAHGFELLQKPYSVEDLSRALRRVTRRERAPRDGKR